MNVIDFLNKEGMEYKAIYEFLCKNAWDGAFNVYLKEGNEQVYRRFFEEIKKVDFKRLSNHKRVLIEFKKDSKKVKYSLDDVEGVSLLEDESDYSSLGLSSLRSGEWASVVLTGGSGTRFFSETGTPGIKTKGLFPISPVYGHNFLEVLLSEVLETGIVSGKLPIWLLMTSRITDDEVKSWIAKSCLWGLPKVAILVFKQEEHPRLDMDGNLIVDENGCLQWTGDGHGGVYKAVTVKREDGNSIKDVLQNKGVRYLVIHNVDNPLAKPFDLNRIGFHINGGYFFTMSCIKRTLPEEKMGIVARLKSNLRYEVIEYSVCGRDILYARDERTGRFLFEAGHINTNIINIDKIEFELEPTLYTDKSITVQKKRVLSSSYETLNQHITRLIDNEKIGLFSVKRSEFFSPTKSISGDDSVENTKAKLSEMVIKIFRELGAEVHTDGNMKPVLDVLPYSSLAQSILKKINAGRGWVIGNGAKLYFNVRYGLDRRPPFNEGFVLEDFSSFILTVEFPYGRFRYNNVNRALMPEYETSGKIYMGRNVKIKKGVSVKIEIKGNGSIRIPDNTVIERNLNIVVGEGENKIIGWGK